MSNNSIIEHRGSYYYVALREEYLIICMKSTYKKQVKEGSKSRASAHCKAFILDILEYWTNTKRGKGEDLAVFMTYQQWSDAMYGMFGRNTIIDSLDELIGEGLIAKEPYKMFGNKDTYQYRLNYQELNKRIQQLPERDPHDTHPKVNASQMKPDASQMKRVTRPKRDVYPSQMGHNIESYIDSNNIDSTERKNDVAQQSSHDSEPQRSSHSSTHTSSSFQSSFSQEKQEEEVTLSPEEQVVYDLGKQTIFQVKPPRITPKVKGQCAQIAKAGIKMLDEMKSLVALTKQETGFKTLHLGNLVNALNGWLQVQKHPTLVPVNEEQKQPKAENDLRTLVRRQKELATAKGEI